jgi:hypothetical protein
MTVEKPEIGSQVFLPEVISPENSRFISDKAIMAAIETGNCAPTRDNYPLLSPNR